MGWLTEKQAAKQRINMGLQAAEDVALVAAPNADNRLAISDLTECLLQDRKRIWEVDGDHPDQITGRFREAQSQRRSEAVALAFMNHDCSGKVVGQGIAGCGGSVRAAALDDENFEWMIQRMQEVVNFTNRIANYRDFVVDRDESGN